MVGRAMHTNEETSRKIGLGRGVFCWDRGVLGVKSLSRQGTQAQDKHGLKENLRHKAGIHSTKNERQWPRVYNSCERL